MTERKTAGWVLGFIVLIIVVFVVVLPEIRFRSTQNLSFKSCKINFDYWDKGLVDDIYRSSQNKLGLCLCSLYIQKPDTSVSNRIIQIYKRYGTHSVEDSIRVVNHIDSIIKYKKAAFDTTIVID